MKRKICFMFIFAITVIIFNSLYAQQHRLTKKERIKECQIPTEELKKISTKELVEKCLDYKFLIDVLLIDNIQRGFDRKKKEFNGFIELNQRNDAGKSIFEIYKNMNPLDAAKKTIRSEKSDLSFNMFYLELFLCQDNILEQLALLKNELLIELCDKYEKKINYNKTYNDNLYSDMSFGFNIISISRVIKKFFPDMYNDLIMKDEKIDNIITNYAIDFLNKKNVTNIISTVREIIH